MKTKIIPPQKTLKPEAVSNKEQINDFLFSFLLHIQQRCFPLQFSEKETVGKWQVRWDTVESVNQNSGIISPHIISRSPHNTHCIHLSQCGNFCCADLTDQQWVFSTDSSFLQMFQAKTWWRRLFETFF